MANRNYIFKTSTEALPALFRDLVEKGAEVGSRDGKTKELTHIGITLTEPWRRELLLPDRKPSLAAQIAETMWVLAGRNDIAWLSRYLPRAADFSDDGTTWRAGYGPRIRNFHQTDQWAEVLKLLHEDPGTRRAVITFWDPTEDYQPSKDIPCNNWISFLIRDGKLDLHVVIRSNDAMWGWSGINAFEWSALQEISAGLLGVEVGSLHFSVASFHLYERHWQRAALISHSVGLPAPATSPRFRLAVSGDQSDFDVLAKMWFNLEEDIYQGFPSKEVDRFPEPMLQSWLRVLQWWWTCDPVYLLPLKDTRLGKAAELSVQPKINKTPLVPYVIRLHADKHQAYGDSWKRRGEMLGILANIARKVDRLGTNSSDETSTDTAIDLLVYLAKYRWWLTEERNAPVPAHDEQHDWPAPLGDPVEQVAVLLAQLERTYQATDLLPAHLEGELTTMFEALENAGPAARMVVVDDMLESAFELAKKLWAG